MPPPDDDYSDDYGGRIEKDERGVSFKRLSSLSSASTLPTHLGCLSPPSGTAAAAAEGNLPAAIAWFLTLGFVRRPASCRSRTAARPLLAPKGRLRERQGEGEASLHLPKRVARPLHGVGNRAVRAGDTSQRSGDDDVPMGASQQLAGDDDAF